MVKKWGKLNEFILECYAKWIMFWSNIVDLVTRLKLFQEIVNICSYILCTEYSYSKIFNLS